MLNQKFVDDIIDKAKSEIEIYGSPSLLLLSISLCKGTELALKLHANNNLVNIAIALMDIKLGEALKDNKVDEHVQLSLDYAKTLLAESSELSEKEKSIIYNSIESHHGSVPHSSLESEIVTCADCYRFIHPLGVVEYIRMLSSRTNNTKEIITKAEAKLHEKWKLITIKIVKQELSPHYKYFTKLFAVAKSEQLA